MYKDLRRDILRKRENCIISICKKDREEAYLNIYKKVNIDMKAVLGQYAKQLSKHIRKSNTNNINIVATGGQLCSKFYNLPWKSDLDLFCSVKYWNTTFNCSISELFSNNNKVFPRPSFLPKYYIFQSASNNYDGENPYIAAVAIFKSGDGREIQFIAIREQFSVLDTVDNFDLNICRIFYDGTNVYTHPTLHHDDKTIYFEKDIYGDEKDIEKRLEKYRGRGFDVQPMCNSNYAIDFPKTKYSNMVIISQNSRFHVDAGFVAHHSGMINAMIYGNMQQEDEYVIDLNHLSAVTPLSVNILLRYLYRKIKSYHIPPSIYWGILQISKYLDIEFAFQKITPQILQCQIEPMALEIAFTHRMSIYNEMISNFLEKMRYVDHDVKPFYEIESDIVQEHVIYKSLTGNKVPDFKVQDVLGQESDESDQESDESD